MLEVFNSADVTAANTYLNTVADPSTSDYFWVGLSDTNVEGTFVWTTSNLVATYFNWKPPFSVCIRTLFINPGRSLELYNNKN